MSKISIFAEFKKFDEDQRMVYGYASTEALDSQGEKVSKGAVEEALPDYLKFSNIREMHQQSAVGVTEEAVIDEKGLYIGAKIVDDNAWNKVKAGVYKGFSIGGKMLSKQGETITKLKLTEISLVDRPANPEAVFAFYKAEGADENEQSENATSENVTKISERKDVNSKEGQRKYGKVRFADPKNKKYPIDTEEHIRAAWNYIHQKRNADKYSSEDLAAIKRRIISAWKGKIDKDGPPAKKTDGVENLQKGLCSVADFAYALAAFERIENSLAFEAQIEEDDSPLPTRLKTLIGELGNLLRDLVEEEVDEIMEDKQLSEKTSDLSKNDSVDLKKIVDDVKDGIFKAFKESFDQQKTEMLGAINKLEDRIIRLESSPADANVSLRQIDKISDSNLHQNTTADSGSKDPVTLIKSIHRQGGKIA